MQRYPSKNHLSSINLQLKHKNYYVLNNLNHYVTKYLQVTSLFDISQWSSGQLISFGWSQQEELLCVQDDGMVLIYDMFGTYQHTFSIGNVSYLHKISFYYQ